MKKLIALFLIVPAAAFAAPKQSLFFTPNQVISIMRHSQGFVVPLEDTGVEGEAPRAIDYGPRTVAVSGIVYRDKNDWTVWVNGERVTPKNLPERLLGMDVNRDKVHIRWMDLKNNRIVNFTLRTHQTYLLDSDTIVPGT